MSLFEHLGHGLYHVVHEILKNYEKKLTEEEETKQRLIKETNKKYEWIWVSQERRELAAKVIAAIEKKEPISADVYNKDPKYIRDLLNDLKRPDLIPA